MADATARPELDRSIHWETRIDDALHQELSTLLLRIYPDDERYFSNGRSWSGARPEVRLIGRLDGRAVAHLGMTRRFLRASDAGRSVLIADTGLVGVDPDLRGTGRGAELLRVAAEQMRELDVEFGFLTTGEDTSRYYASSGWRRASNPVVHAIDLDDRTEAYAGPAMYLPVTASEADWPTGELERNAREI